MGKPDALIRNPLFDAREHAWVALLRAHRRALQSVEQALRESDQLPLEWYDVLLELEREGPLRPRDLQDRLLFAQYNLSRLLDRMEKAGLVERSPCPDDARCQWINPTAAGMAARKKAWPVYAAAIDRALGAELDEGSAARLAELLAQVRPTA